LEAGLKSLVPAIQFACVARATGATPRRPLKVVATTHTLLPLPATLLHALLITGRRRGHDELDTDQLRGQHCRHEARPREPYRLPQILRHSRGLAGRRRRRCGGGHAGFLPHQRRHSRPKTHGSLLSGQIMCLQHTNTSPVVIRKGLTSSPGASGAPQRPSLRPRRTLGGGMSAPVVESGGQAAAARARSSRRPSIGASASGTAGARYAERTSATPSPNTSQK